ncbi:unnamed protein product, partial [Trichogramma brassicae]
MPGARYTVSRAGERGGPSGAGVADTMRRQSGSEQTGGGRTLRPAEVRQGAWPAFPGNGQMRRLSLE